MIVYAIKNKKNDYLAFPYSFTDDFNKVILFKYKLEAKKYISFILNDKHNDYKLVKVKIEEVEE